MNLEQAKAVYRAAIEPGAGDADPLGAAWWATVADEVRAVVDAPDARAAASVISWWHADWRAVGDTPAQAAQRLRRAARRLRTALA